MENKTKLVLFGLIGILVVLGVSNILTLFGKQAVVKELEAVRAEKSRLEEQLERRVAEQRSLEQRITSLNGDLQRLNDEKVQVQQKFDLVSQERQQLQELIDRLKEERVSAVKQQTETAQAKPQPVLSSTEESYWADVLKGKKDLEFQITTIRNELKSLQIANEELTREKSSLDLEMQNLSRENKDLQQDVSYKQKVIDSTCQDLVREKNDKLYMEENLKTIKTENKTLRRQLWALNNRKVNLERKLLQLQEQKNSVEGRLTDMETMLTDKISNINDLKEKLNAIRQGRAVDMSSSRTQDHVELPPIVVRPQVDSPYVDAENILGQEGEVVSINRVDNFVVVDLGEEAGVKIGDMFTVYRNDEAIAELEVIQTRNTVAACDIKRETTPIQKGDAVK